MRIDARNELEFNPNFKVRLNGIELDNVVAVDTEERWIVRRLDLGEIHAAADKGMTFAPGVIPEEIVYLSRNSRLEIMIERIAA